LSKHDRICCDYTEREVIIPKDLVDKTKKGGATLFLRGGGSTEADFQHEAMIADFLVNLEELYQKKPRENFRKISFDVFARIIIHLKE
jgi:hypothetical protein